MFGGGGRGFEPNVYFSNMILEVKSMGFEYEREREKKRRNEESYGCKNRRGRKERGRRE